MHPGRYRNRVTAFYAGHVGKFDNAGLRPIDCTSRFKIALALASVGSDINAAHPNGHGTVLHRGGIGALNGGLANTPADLDQMLAAGADPNALNVDGLSPAHVFAQHTKKLVRHIAPFADPHLGFEVGNPLYHCLLRQCGFDDLLANLWGYDGDLDGTRLVCEGKSILGLLVHMRWLPGVHVCLLKGLSWTEVSQDRFRCRPATSGPRGARAWFGSPAEGAPYLTPPVHHFVPVDAAVQ